MTRIKGQLTTADYLPIAEYNRLVRGLEKDGEYLWETYCWLSFCTACRASDVRTLRWKDILGKSTMTRIEQKTKKNRLIKFNRDVQEKNRFLYEMLGQPAPEQYIFLSPRTGKPYSLEYINRLLKVFKVRYRLPIRALARTSEMPSSDSRAPARASMRPSPRQLDARTRILPDSGVVMPRNS